MFGFDIFVLALLLFGPRNMGRDPERFDIYKGYVHNIADWLVADRAVGAQTGAAA